MSVELTRDQKIVLSKVQRTATKETLQAFANGNITSQAVDYFLKVNVTSKSGYVRLLDSNSEQRDGVISFIKNELPNYTNLLVKRIALEYATDATATDPADVAYNNVRTNVETALEKASLHIKQNDKMLVNVPLSLGFAGAASHFAFGARETSINLDDNPIYLFEKQPIEIGLQLPKDKAVDGTAQHFLGIHLIGLATWFK